MTKRRLRHLELESCWRNLRTQEVGEIIGALRAARPELILSEADNAEEVKRERERIRLNNRIDEGGGDDYTETKRRLDEGYCVTCAPPGEHDLCSDDRECPCCANTMAMVGGV